MLRARCASKEQLSNYFKELGTIMTQNGLIVTFEDLGDVTDWGFVSISCTTFGGVCSVCSALSSML
jgi:hypothetical protein